jgi:hypothetical protein
MLTVTLLNSCFWVGIWLLMARFFRDVLARLLATLVVGFSAILISLELLSLVDAIRIVPVTWVCGFVLILGIIARKWPATGRLGSEPDSTKDSSTEGVSRTDVVKIAAILVVGFATWAALDGLLYGFFTPVLVDSDAPIYHLPFAIHWARVGQLDFVSTPFGEEGAPYFPANGDLWLTWLALTSRFAAVIKIGQWPFLPVAGLALYAIARQSGASCPSAAIAAGLWCCLPLTLRQSSVANVDLIWTAFYFIAVVFVMRYREASRSHLNAFRELWLAALSLGIVLGTKSVGLVYAPLLIAPVIWMTWVRGPSAAAGSIVGSTDHTPDNPLNRAHRRPSLAMRFRGIGVVIAGILLPSGYWFARNLWMTGNPLYPLDVSWFDHRILVGWYDTSAMRETAYHIRVYDWPLLESRLVYTAGPFLLGLWFMCIIAGMLATIRTIGAEMKNDVQFLSVLAVLHVGIYWFVLPYNTQERFLLPALGVGLVPLSTWISRWPWLIWPLGLVLMGHLSMALFGGATNMDDVSFRTLRTLVEIGAGGHGITFVGSLVVAGTLALERRKFGWILSSAVIATGCVLYAAPLASFFSRNPERGFYPAIGFGTRMLPAWQIVEQESRPAPARIAYAGGNLPYYLLGSDYRNEAIYVNTNRHRSWLPHDYHKARRLAGKSDTAAIPWPQWYREEADYQAWLKNLRAEQIDLLFVSRTNLHGRSSSRPDELLPFPIERIWADAHPEEFEYLGPQPATQGSIPWACVYRLRDH